MNEKDELQVIYFGCPGTGKSYTIKSLLKSNGFSEKGYKNYLEKGEFKNERTPSNYASIIKRTKELNVLPNGKDSIFDISDINELCKIEEKLNKEKEIEDFSKTDSEKATIRNVKSTIIHYKKYLQSLLENEFRTVFYPDYDYDSFVGSYKPSMNGEKIVYGYVPQVFTKAYVYAWNHLNEPTYLVIEEINRGNCAQIFGDLFQLLDRGDDNYSEYPIDSTSDLSSYLKDYLKISEGINVKNIEAIKSGKKLVLPPNFHIFATMNTSDQSLFPMDSAFKRRWSWKYVPISAQKFQKDKQWKIKIDEDFSHEWGDFVEKINVKIAEITHSEDKQIGYFFCKANGDSCIDKETFVSKVVFYLWNDIFKDYGDNLLFKNKEGNLMFHDFFGDNGEIKTDIVEAFINNVFREK